MLMPLMTLLAMIAFVGSSQDDDSVSDKECSYTLDVVTLGVLEEWVFVVIDQCSFIESEADEDDEEDLEVSWMYTCEDHGGHMDMYMTMYEGPNCDTDGNSTMLFEDGDEYQGTLWQCIDPDDEDNCDVKMEWRTPCTGSATAEGTIWPAKDTCIATNESSYAYNCYKGDDGHDIRFKLTDSLTCGEDFSVSYEFVLYESGCDNEIQIDIDCNSASSVNMAIASIIALAFALIR